MTSSRPTCWILGGPNGAGKTTFALNYLPKVAACSTFINADLIASGLSPLAPEAELLAASRIFRVELEKAISKKENFAFETTLAGRGYLKLVRRLQQDGWRVELLYLALPSVAASKSRVAWRVAHGGHSIPEKDLERRFPRSLYNLLYEYGPLVDRVVGYLNEGDLPTLVFEQQGDHREVIDEEIFQQFIGEAKK